MEAMRLLAAAALAALSLVAAGCGASASGVASGASLGSGAADLVPADATAFATADTDLGSTQWKRVDELTKDFPARAKLLARIDSELQKRQLTWKDDIEPALGPETDVAILGKDDVVFTKPDDKGKLRALATKLSTSEERYTVQEIGGWSVVADAQDVFDRVRATQSGQSLADAAAFKTAWAQVGGDALFRAYATSGALAGLPRIVTPGTGAQWFAVRAWADDDALRLDAVAKPQGAPPATTTQPLLHDVPSGATLAVAFHGGADLSRRLSSLAPNAAGGRFQLTDLGALANSDGVAYVRASGLLPEIAIELAPKNPQKALGAARDGLRTLGGALGAVPLTAQLSNGKLVISDGPAAVAALRSGGPKLPGDRAYKDAIRAAGVPARTTFLAYADVTALAPFIQVLAAALGGPMHQSDPSLGDNLAHVGTVVAWGSADGGLARLGAWIAPR
jgi:hypothetical protein